MKQYTPPKIKSVVLDPEQAILEVCRVGGAYMYYGNPNYACVEYKSFGESACPYKVRGGAKNFDSVGASYASEPS